MSDPLAIIVCPTCKYEIRATVTWLIDDKVCPNCGEDYND